MLPHEYYFVFQEFLINQFKIGGTLLSMWLCLALIGVLVFLCLRKRKVNCWFCGMDSYVRKSDVEWWFCYKCHQHNGFTENGDYRNEINEMYLESFSTKQYCSYFDEIHPLKSNNEWNLCGHCQRNQERKVEELKGFVATNEAYFDVECDDYERYLSKKYALCASCSSTIRHQIQQQDHQIKEMYSEELERLKPEPLRKLKSDTFGGTSCGHRIRCLINVTCSVCLVLVPLLLKQVLNGNISNEDKALILSGVSLLALVVNAALFHSHVSWFQSFLTFRWLTLICIFNSEWNSYVPITLDMLLVVEVYRLSRRTYVYLQQQWRRKRYLDERKRKIARIKPNSYKKSQESSTEKENPSIAEEDSQYPDLPSPSVVCNALVSMDGGIETKERCSIVTPDLLQGHLNNMFIDKREGTVDMRSKDRTDVNHVVAALKYRTNPRSMVKQPLIKPATFTLSNNTNSTQRMDSSCTRRVLVAPFNYKMMDNEQ